jgi:putative tricarboxylic transport membrane protein
MIAAAVDGPWDYFFTGSLNITLITLVVASILWSFFTSGKTAPAGGTPSQLAKPQQEAS